FRNAEAAIYKQLVESSSTGDYGVIYSSLRIGGWTAFLAMGIISPNYGTKFLYAPSNFNSSKRHY
ncbi:MAG: hypothetical protein ACKPEQ_26620, partial [Dolichospermum sp.]